MGSIAYASNTIEYSNTVEKLRKINMARNEKEEKLSNEKYISFSLRRELKELKDILSQKDTTIEDLNSQIKSKERKRDLKTALWSGFFRKTYNITYQAAQW